MYILFISILLFAIKAANTSDFTYIDQLPEKEKQQFLGNIARRILEEVKVQDDAQDRPKEGIEVTDEQLNVHDAFVKKIMKEEEENFRRQTNNKTEMKNDSTKSNIGRILPDEVIKAENYVDLTLRADKNRAKRESVNKRKVFTMISPDDDSDNREHTSKESDADIQVKNFKKTLDSFSNTMLEKIEGDPIVEKITKNTEAILNQDQNYETTLHQDTEIISQDTSKVNDENPLNDKKLYTKMRTSIPNIDLQKSEENSSNATLFENITAISPDNNNTENNRKESDVDISAKIIKKAINSFDNTAIVEKVEGGSIIDKITKNTEAISDQNKNYERNLHQDTVTVLQDNLKVNDENPIPTSIQSIDIRKNEENLPDNDNNTEPNRKESDFNIPINNFKKTIDSLNTTDELEKTDGVRPIISKITNSKDEIQNQDQKNEKRLHKDTYVVLQDNLKNENLTDNENMDDKVQSTIQSINIKRSDSNSKNETLFYKTEVIRNINKVPNEEQDKQTTVKSDSHQENTESATEDTQGLTKVKSSQSELFDALKKTYEYITFAKSNNTKDTHKTRTRELKDSDMIKIELATVKTNLPSAVNIDIKAKSITTTDPNQLKMLKSSSEKNKKSTSNNKDTLRFKRNKQKTEIDKNKEKPKSNISKAIHQFVDKFLNKKHESYNEKPTVIMNKKPTKYEVFEISPDESPFVTIPTIKPQTKPDKKYPQLQLYQTMHNLQQSDKKSKADFNKIMPEIQLDKNLLQLLQSNKEPKHESDKIQLDKKLLKLLQSNSGTKYKTAKKQMKPLKSQPAVQEQPYYVPIYNYKPKNAYFDPHNMYGRHTNSDDEDGYIIYNVEGYKVPSMVSKSPKKSQIKNSETEEQPYYVPIYNYSPQYAFFNPKNRYAVDSQNSDEKLNEVDENIENYELDVNYNRNTEKNPIEWQYNDDPYTRVKNGKQLKNKPRGELFEVDLPKSVVDFILKHTTIDLKGYIDANYNKNKKNLRCVYKKKCSKCNYEPKDSEELSKNNENEDIRESPLLDTMSKSRHMLILAKHYSFSEPFNMSRYNHLLEEEETPNKTPSVRSFLPVNYEDTPKTYEPNPKENNLEYYEKYYDDHGSNEEELLKTLTKYNNYTTKNENKKQNILKYTNPITLIYYQIANENRERTKDLVQKPKNFLQERIKMYKKPKAQFDYISKKLKDFLITYYKNIEETQEDKFHYAKPILRSMSNEYVISDEPKDKELYKMIQELAKFLNEPEMVKLYLQMEKIWEEKKERKEEEKEAERSRTNDEIDAFVEVIGDMIKENSEGLKHYDWLGSTVDLQSAIKKMIDMINSVRNHEDIHPSDLELLKYIAYLHAYVREEVYPKTTSRRGIVIPHGRRPKRIITEPGLMAWQVRTMYPDYIPEQKLHQLEMFLEDLQAALYDLHTALKYIAMVTKYKNQTWFESLKQIHFEGKRKQLLEIILHLCTTRLFGIIEESAKNGVEDDFIEYAKKNEKEVEDTSDEFLFVLQLLEEIKRIK